MKTFLFLLGTFAGAVSAIALVLGAGWRNSPFLATTVTCDNAYGFLNPQLRCLPFEELQKQEYVEFKSRVERYIQEKIASGGIKQVSVYFRDLENGPWFGIEEDALFSPASMLKVPVMIAYYKQAEAQPELLERRIEVAGSTSAPTTAPETGSLQVGGEYTVDELIRRMIVYSDNVPLHILLGYLKQAFPEEDVFADTLAEMGLAKSEGSEADFLTVKRYTSIYRALYNSSFLSKEMSQAALTLLTKTSSPHGIDDGVPAGTPVAHKYGIRDSEGQLHDCGIVYHPGTHYLLCIMTKGNDTNVQGNVITDISRMLYEEVSRRENS